MQEGGESLDWARLGCWLSLNLSIVWYEMAWNLDDFGTSLHVSLSRTDGISYSAPRSPYLFSASQGVEKRPCKSVANFSSSDGSNHGQHLCYFLADGDTFITRNTNTSPCSWEYLGVTDVTSGRAPYMLNARVLCIMQSLARGLSSNA
jgi:hypothetical protein